VGYVDQRVFMPVVVKDFAAWAPHQGTRFLRRHLFASLPHGIFALSPIALRAPRLKIGLCPVRQKHPPGLLKIGAGPVERGRGAVGAFPRMGAGIEAAGPLPRIFARRHASAERNHAHAHVTVKDVPAFVGSIERAAAGKGGHEPLKRGRTHSANYQSLGDRETARLLRVVGVEIRMGRVRDERSGEGWRQRGADAGLGAAPC